MIIVLGADIKRGPYFIRIKEITSLNQKII